MLECTSFERGVYDYISWRFRITTPCTPFASIQKYRKDKDAVVVEFYDPIQIVPSLFYLKNSMAGTSV